MLFQIEADDGSAVRGWVRPDNPSVLPAISVDLDDGRRVLLAASRDSRVTASGEQLWRFSVDERTCPSIAETQGLSIYEAHSHTLIYRRTLDSVAPIRLFHLEFDARRSLVPVLGPLFQMSYGWVEFMGEESLKSVLGLRAVPSLLVAGGLLQKRFARDFAKGGFKRSTILYEPNRLLAATLLGLKDLSAHPGARAGWRSQGRASLLARIAAADLGTPGQLGRFLKRLEMDELRLLADPITRRLAATQPDQTLGDAHLSAALEQLAEFDAIGFEGEPQRFALALQTLTGLPVAIERSRDEDLRLRELESVIAACAEAQNLIAFDLDLFASARTALDRAGR